MKYRKTNRVIKRPPYFIDNSSLESQYSNYLYNSKSSLIRFYAYLPFIFTLKNVKFSESSLVLDIGCADGPFLPTLNYNSKYSVAIDINEDYVRESKSLIEKKLSNSKKINLFRSDAELLPFKDNIFDLIFGLEALEHFKYPKKAIKEIHRVLKNQGIFICTLPVEIGLSLLIRNFLGKILNYERPHYNLRQFLKNIFLKRTGKRPVYKDYKDYIGDKGHKNFDWRKIHHEIKKYFKSVKIKYFPISFLKGVNPFILIKANK